MAITFLSLSGTCRKPCNSPRKSNLRQEPSNPSLRQRENGQFVTLYMFYWRLGREVKVKNINLESVTVDSKVKFNRQQNIYFNVGVHWQTTHS